MSKKDVHIRLEGRGHFADVVKDMDADLVIAYIMNFGEDATDTDIAMVGHHTIGSEAFAAQLGRVTASMLISAFDNNAEAPKYWTKFEEAFKDELAKKAETKLKEMFIKLKEMFEDDDDEEDRSDG